MPRKKGSGTHSLLKTIRERNRLLPNRSQRGFLEDYIPPQNKTRPKIGDDEHMPTRRDYESFDDFYERISRGLP